MTRRKPTTGKLPASRARTRDAVPEAPVEPAPVNKGGRPPHVLDAKTRAQAELCIAFGNTHDQTAKIMGISKPTLEKYYGPEIEAGYERTMYRLSTNVYRQAMKDDLRAAEHAKWILARRTDVWKDVSRHEHTGKAGGPIQHEIDYSKLTDADLEQLERILTAAAPSEG